MAYYEHITILRDNQVKCTLCEENILNNDRLLEAHLHDKKHSELYMKTLMTCNNIFRGASELFCYICHCGIEISELISHVQSTTHQSKLTLIKEIILRDGGLLFLPEKISSLSVVSCIICDREIDFTLDSVKEHVSSMNHKRARAMVLQPLNGIFSVEGSDKYLWCKLCQIFFDNYIELIFQHCEESDHFKKISKLLRIIDGQDIDMENYLQDLKEDKALCKRCRIEVPCNVDNLQSHVRGKKHTGS